MESSSGGGRGMEGREVDGSIGECVWRGCVQRVYFQFPAPEGRGPACMEACMGEVVEGKWVRVM